MKKNLIAMTVAAIGLLSFAGCNPEFQEYTPEGILTEPEQQARMENVLEEFTEAMPPAAFKELTMDVAKFMLTYNDFDIYTDVAEQFYDISCEQVQDLSNIDENFSSFTEYALAFAPFYGTIDLESGEDAKAVYTPDLEKGMVEINFSLPEINEEGELDNTSVGDVFQMTIEQIGEKKEVFLGSMLTRRWETIQIPVEPDPAPEDNAGNDGVIVYGESGDEPTPPEFTDKDIRVQKITEIRITVPEKLVIKLTKNGEAYADFELVPVWNISTGGLDLKKDFFGISTTLHLAGLTLEMPASEVDFAAEKASGSVIVSRDQKEILKLEAYSEIAFALQKKEFTKVNPITKKEYKVIDSRVIPTKLKDIRFSTTLMGDLQIRTQCTNPLQVASILLPAIVNIQGGMGPGPGGPLGSIIRLIIANEDISTTLGSPIFTSHDLEAKMPEWTRKVSVLNKFLSCGAYFQGSDLKQAAVTFLPKATEMPGSMRPETGSIYVLSLSPVITYPDGTVLRMLEWAAGLDFGDMYLYGFDWVEMIESALSFIPYD